MTGDFTRRDFLSTTALMAAAAALPMPARATMPQGFDLNGKLHIIGLNSGPGTKPSGYVMPDSVLTTLDLATGATRRSELPITDGHAALPFGDGRLACISHHGPRSCIVDADHAVIAQLIAPENYLFGGHALVLPDRKAFVVPARHAVQRDASDHGRGDGRGYARDRQSVGGRGPPGSQNDRGRVQGDKARLGTSARDGAAFMGPRAGSLAAAQAGQ